MILQYKRRNIEHSTNANEDDDKHNSDAQQFACQDDYSQSRLAHKLSFSFSSFFFCSSLLLFSLQSTLALLVKSKRNSGC